MKSKRAVLITGFEPFGGDATNPSQAIAEALDGRRIADMPVVGRVLPVEMARLDSALAAALRGLDPAAVILLGLAEGEPVVRLERVALNLADFRIPDNAGDRRADEPLDPRGPAALSSRLPLREIRTALLAAGIPARLSETAGTYLCNAAMYRALSRLPARVCCGFIHLPLSPAEVAARLDSDSGLPIQPSMSLSVQRKAVEIAVAATLAARPKIRRSKA